MIQTQPLSNDAAFDRWQTDLLKEAINHRHSVWSIGDLLLEGERKFEDARYVQALEATRLTIETLMNYKSLAKCFPAGKRRLNLGVSHHEATRSLDEGARDAMLDLVEKHEISRENLRDRVKAYKGGDVGALAFNWRQPNKVTEVEDSHAGVSDDDDRPVFDSTSAGEGMAGERASSERPDFEASDANQTMLKALDLADRALGASNRPHIILENVNTARLRATAAEMLRLADDADHVQSGRWSKKAIPARAARSSEPASVASSEAAEGGDADLSPASPPDNSHRSAGIAASVVTPPAGRGADESPVLNSAHVTAPQHMPDSGEGRVVQPVLTSPQTNAPSLSNRDVSAGEEPSPRVGPQAEALHAGIGSGTLAVHDGHTQSGAAQDDEASVTNGQAAPSSIHEASATRAPNNAALSEAEALAVPDFLRRKKEAAHG